MNNPYFSIVVPTLNEETYLPKLLNALTHQAMTDFEVIVVDGASTDKTVALAKQFNQFISLRLLTKKPRNVSLQRNIGVAQARGAYLVFLDADVVPSPDFLAQMHRRIMSTRVDFASCRTVPDNHKLVDRVVTFTMHLFMVVMSWFGKPFMSGQNMFIKRSVFLEVGGFDTTILFDEDAELVQRAADMGFNGKLFFMPSLMVSFRRFEREGIWMVLWSYFRANIYLLFKGPIRKHLFSYHMGGSEKKT